MAKVLRNLSLYIYKSLKMPDDAEKKQLRLTTGSPKGGWWACVSGLALAWLHSGGLCFIWRGECCLDLGASFSAFRCICRDLRNGAIGIWFGISMTCWAWSVGLLYTGDGLCYGSLTTFMGNPTRLFQLRETLI